MFPCVLDYYSLNCILAKIRINLVVFPAYLSI